MNSHIDILESEDATLVTSTKNMHADLMGIIINTCKGLPDVWQRLSEDSQQDFIESIDKQVGEVVETCVKHISADGRPYVLANIAQVTFKGNAEAKMVISKTPDGAMPGGAFELAENTGESAMIILPGISQYTPEEGEKPQAASDQPDLLDTASDELYDDAVEYARENGWVSISGLQRFLKVGYNRAARLVELMAHAGMISSYEDNPRRDFIG